ncbi:DUF2971 domain-containing protein [Mitsuaria sp. GD03876]|uniref:DUF2971 domain-containing protein n=1 Tax=Mitsuaria sp. GD03876 TaxID=2975399 RepID=UPI00244BCA66|nr:DUF2971 domain-containing protein [Mitsuaria sp. GD03876]MDH0863236.1 DUF2971 domain-containing protein [Mitsuaria sp. GD03876]
MVPRVHFNKATEATLEDFKVQAPSDDTVLWRYMDLSKLLSLLEDKKLVFPRADILEDLYEGHWSDESLRQLKALEDEGGTAQAIAKQPFVERERMFVSCWHENPSESAAMWRIFLKSNDGVAIRTTVSSLKEQLRRTYLHVEFGRVRYIDYSEDFISHLRTFYPYFHKRKDFEHEKEVRAVVWNMPSGTHQIRVEPGSKVFSIDVNPVELIHSIVIAPKADSWFKQLVEKVVKNRYGLNCEITSSKVDTAPVRLRDDPPAH